MADRENMGDRPLPEPPLAQPGALAVVRTAALAGAVAVGAAYAVQLLSDGRFAVELVDTNDVSQRSRRILLLWMVVAGALGGLSVAALSVWCRRRQRDFGAVERNVRLLSPLGLLGVAAPLLRRLPWLDSALELLVATLLCTLLVEGALLGWLRAFSASSWSARCARLVARVPTRIVGRAPLAIVTVSSTALTLVLFQIALVRHQRLMSAAFDLGICDNSLFSALRGHFVVSSVFTGNVPHPAPFLAGHAQFGQYVLLPFYALAPRAETLLLLQAALASFSALPLFAFARRRVGAGLALVLALAWLVSPALHGAALYEATYLPVAAFFVLSTLWAYDAGRRWTLALALLAALSMREDISVGLSIVSLALLLEGRRVRAAALMLVGSVAYFVVVRFVVMNLAGHWSFPDMMYKELLPPNAPKTFATVIATVVSNPFFVLGKLCTLKKLTLLLQLLVPLALLPLRRGWAWIALLPGTLLTLLTTGYDPTVQLGFHYVMHWLPYLFAVTVVVLAALRSVPEGELRQKAAAGALVFASAVCTFHFGAIARPPKYRIGFATFDFTFPQSERERYDRLVAMAAQIPRDASVAASDALVPHVSNRVTVYVTDDNGIQEAEYVLVWRENMKRGKNTTFFMGALAKEYGAVAFDHDFILARRGADKKNNPAAVLAWR